MDLINFVLVLVIILVSFYAFKEKENFASNQGLYNYFFQSYMNPYPLPLNKFFSNDKKEING